MLLLLNSKYTTFSKTSLSVITTSKGLSFTKTDSAELEIPATG